MKKLIIVLFTVFLIITNAKAQHFFSVAINQPEALIADAGDDATLTQGKSITIGGSPSALYGYGNYSYFWSPEETLDNNTIANPLASPSEATIYTLTVTDNLGCTSQSSVIINVLTEINEHNQQIKIYPNPLTQNTVLNISGISGKVEIKISDLNGKVIFTEKKNPESGNIEIETKNIPEGSYFLIISGKKINITKTLIIL